jgi:methionyl-tRNA formyltransferase
VNWVLVHGEAETGASLHYMVAKADAGDLVDQERVSIALEDTAYSLYGKLETAARRVLDRALPALRNGTARSAPMDLKAGSYFSGRKPDDGKFDWSWPAEKIYNLIRAVTHPYPGAFTLMRGNKVLVWWAVPVESASGAVPGTVIESGLNGLTVATGKGALRLVTVQPERGPELPACTYALLEGITKGELL